MRARSAGNMTLARRLAEEAVHRDPRLAAARLWLAQDAISQGRFEDAINHLDWLYAVAPDARATIATAIAQLAGVPRARAVVERHAALSPSWLEPVVENLIWLKADPGTIFRVSGGMDVRPGLLVGGKSAIIRDLLARKDYDRAYLAWVANLPPNLVGSVGYVYDGLFQHLPGLPPFNWNLVDSDVASVDFAGGGGANISYFGNGQAHFLDQTVMLPPGTFRVRMVAALSSEGQGEPNKATLTLACAAGSSAGLASVPVPAKAVPVPAEATFSVASDCPIQTVSLDGTPSEYPVTTQITVKSIMIVKTGAGS